MCFAVFYGAAKSAIIYLRFKIKKSTETFYYFLKFIEERWLPISSHFWHCECTLFWKLTKIRFINRSWEKFLFCLGHSKWVGACSLFAVDRVPLLRNFPYLEGLVMPKTFTPLQIDLSQLFGYLFILLKSLKNIYRFYLNLKITKV